MEIKIVSSLEKAGIGEELPELGSALLTVLPGETASFQIAFRDASAGNDSGAEGAEPVSEDRKIRARILTQVSECAGLPSEGKIPENAENTEKLDVHIRKVLQVMCRKSCNPDAIDEDYLFYDARMAPDLLRELEPGEELPVTGEWQSLWVDICPKESQKRRKYHIEFTLEQTAGEETQKGGNARILAGVTVQVAGQELPRLAIPHTEWFHCDGIADYYGVEAFSEEFWRIFRNFVAVYVKRGGNTILTPVITPPLDTEVGGERTTIQLADVELTDGEYKLGFGNLERFLDICLEEGIEHFEICHLFSQWGAAATPKVMAKKDGAWQRIFGWETPSDDPEYLRFLSVLLPALKKLLAERGLLESAFFHISDEPNLDSVHYKTAHGMVRKLLEGCTIIEAVSDYAYYEKGLVDIPVCGIDHIKPFLEKRPPRLWAYYCCAQATEVPNRFISMPSWRNRIYGTLLYWHKIDGVLHWGFNFYNSMYSKRKIDPYETVDADEGFPAGDAFLVYPGKDGIPEESIRLMVFEEGLADYRALCLLETYIGREKVMELIRREAGMELSFFQYPKNAEFILRLREKVNGLLDSFGESSGQEIEYSI